VIVLASASPRRAELLRGAGIPFEVIVADVDETVYPGEQPEIYALRVAAAKAQAVSERADGRPVLAADTVVIVHDQILGKPVDAGDARRMLRLLSGRAHHVLTAVVLDDEVTLERTQVQFAALGDDEIDWYVASGEPHDKAGAYAIQGLAARFVTRIDGSYSNVVGLPVSRVYQLLRRRALI
jgi:septum formation protein